MALSKAEYLKRYLAADVEAADAGQKKKKRRKKLSSVKATTGLKIVDEDLDLAKLLPADCELEDDNPTVAEIIDERPEAVRQLEEYRENKKWKKMTKMSNIDSYSSTIKQEIDSNCSPSGKERLGSDSSPPRRKRNDSDNSPPRRKRNDSDNSPPRRKRNDSDSSPPRRKRNDSDSSPPRRKRNDSDSSPPRRKRNDSDSSPPRRKRNDSDSSPPRRKRNDSDSSPPRRKRNDSDSSPPRRKRNDSDSSPPRRKRNDSDSSPPRRKRNDSDSSPPRRKRNDSDSSPPRRKRNDSDSSPPRKQNISHTESNNSTTTNKTLSGKIAGLSSAQDMKKEAEKLKLKELQMFNKIDDEVLGKNAHTVFRDKTGKKRNLASEKEQDDAKSNEWKEKYDKWNKGVAQGAAEKERITEMAHEMNKPLARTKDDADLDSFLKNQDRDGDPMLAFLKKKKSAKSKAPKYPQYKGPAPEPNRFGIRPGYRWDGVDRGNGFERKYFQSISKRKAVAAEAYKWSTEDM